ncbi:hypothetical protein GCM10023081_13280 [Arthrobacter ginkgonis]|uniref:DAGKc domain-containing protein n=1 Tax=Arthrobacter ginkgonis TaxID=1630594 RepID=A0ABP7C4F2_9MICC
MSSGRTAARFSWVVVVFNPDPGKLPVHVARWLREGLAVRLPGIQVDLRPTDRAGHGREVARTAACASLGNPGAAPVLVVAVSGDGGYNDVVNGVMDVPGSNVVCMVLAGNANDHHRSVGSLPALEAIVDGPVRLMDLLRLTVTGDRMAPVVRFAHSYIGFGLTAAMARVIEHAGKGRIRELTGVARTLPRLRPFEIERADDARARFASLVLANVSRMAKYGTVSDSRDPSDGRFEVIGVPTAGRWGPWP